MVNCRSISLNFYRGQKNRKKYTIVLFLIIIKEAIKIQNSSKNKINFHVHKIITSYFRAFDLAQFPLDYLKLAANVSQITRNNIDFTRGIGGKFAHTPREIIRVVKKE